jgi:hypothetical protein
MGSISLSDFHNFSPDLCVSPDGYVINIEEAWPPELEASLLEAIMLFRTRGKRKIRDSHGNLHGKQYKFKYL